MSRIKTSRQRVQYGFKGISSRTDEKVLDPAYAVRAYNFTFRGGVLKSDLGIDPASGYYLDSLVLRHTYPSFPETVAIVDAFVYHRRTADGMYDDRVVVQTDENKLYYTKIFSVDIWHEIAGLSFSGKACAVNYNYNGDDVLLLCSNNNSLIILNDITITTVANAPKFNSLAVHYERIYGTVNGNRNQVWFSDDFAPTNWAVSGAEAGYITFADECGDVCRAVSFLGYLYVFREHGIFRLTAYGDQSEFSLKKVFIDTGMIYKDTIAVCGDRIIFLAEEGLFSFDGYDVVRMTVDLPYIETKNTAVGAYHENRYYLACKIYLGDFYVDLCENNVLLEFDVREKTLCVLAPLDVGVLLPLNVHHATDLIIVLKRGTVNKLGMIGVKGRIFGTTTSKVYSSPDSALGTGRFKTVRDITLTTDKPLTLTVKVDDKSYSYSLTGKSEPQTVFVGRAGKTVCIELNSSALNAYVTPLSVTMDLM